MSDDLLPKVAAGDAAAVEQCLRRYSGRVWALALRACADAQDAEDVVQEIFVELWRSAARFDAGVASELTFVLTIARRRLVDRVRRRGRRPVVESLESGGPAAEADDHGGMANLEQSDELTRARGALQQLRPEQRRVLEMALVDGHTHQEIAAHIGIPLGTVKSHARRGLMRVREMLGVDRSEPGGAR